MARRRLLSTARALCLVLAAGFLPIASGQEAPHKPPVEAAKPAESPNPFDPLKPNAHEAVKSAPDNDLLKRAEESIKPLPLEAIPDDPPPHEGAMIQISSRVEPPDLILVEVLEALPGRPITGERLVKPDGTVSLGFYGDVHVAGRTAAQIKTKIVLHLRQFLNDYSLGLVRWSETGPGPRSPTRPFDPLPELPVFEDPTGLPAPSTALPPGDQAREGAEKAEPKGKEAEPNPNPPPVAQPAQPPPAQVRPIEIVEFFPGVKIRGFRMPADELLQNPHARQAGSAAVPSPLPAVPTAGGYIYENPADSDRVFVDIAAYNSRYYYVIGDVGSPGRIVYTGHETVFDALQFAGGLIPAANRQNIRLNRPARGDKPMRTYRIDLDAIERGEKKANLQLFPGDRLIIGRQGDQRLPLQ